jgi:hypothetical protein
MSGIPLKISEEQIKYDMEKRVLKDIKKHSISVFIPKIREDGNCWDCPYYIHSYEDDVYCIFKMGEEGKGIAEYFPGVKCPRYLESQRIRKNLEVK